jgi:hypothetical protein
MDAVGLPHQLASSRSGVLRVSLAVFRSRAGTRTSQPPLMVREQNGRD